MNEAKAALVDRMGRMNREVSMNIWESESSDAVFRRGPFQSGEFRRYELSAETPGVLLLGGNAGRNIDVGHRRLLSLSALEKQREVDVNQTAIRH